jgi:inner membrane protein YidH
VSDPTPNPQRIDATRRTHLANERTYLAWLRSGLTSVAVGLGVAKFLPDFGGGAAWPYVVLGTGFCVLGVAMVVLGIRRLRQVSAGLERGAFGPLEDTSAIGIGVATIVLAVAAILVVVANR